MLLSDFTTVTIDGINHHKLYNQLGKLMETNSLGSKRMLSFATEIVERFADFNEPINFVLRGKPYAPFNMAYKVQFSDDNDEFGSGWLIGLVFYPAGFCFRLNDMLLDKEAFISEIRQILEKQKGERQNLCVVRQNQENPSIEVCIFKNKDGACSYEYKNCYLDH